MKKIIKFCFKYGSLAGYLVLAIVLIVEASLPGSISASHSNTVGNLVNEFVDIDFDKEHKYINPTKVEIKNQKTEIALGESYRVETEVYPSDASNKSIIYSIDDTEIAKINSNGVVSFIKEGTVKVTVQINDTELTDEIVLTSYKVEAEEITIICKNDDRNIELGESEYLYVDFLPLNTSYKNVEWTSSDNNIATINNDGKITPVNVGNVTFTVTSSNGLQSSIDFSIIESNPEHVHPTSIKITFNGNNINDKIELIEQQTYTFNAIVYPEEVTNNKVKWVSSDSNIATVRNGVIKTIKNGTVTIKAISYADSSISYSFKIKVKSIEPVFTIQKINDKNEINPNASIKLQLDFESMPNIYTIKWESSNNDICSVDNDGVINTKKTGNVTIKVICEAGDGTIVEKTIDIKIANQQNTNKISSFYLAIRKGIGHFGAFFILAVFAAFVVIFFTKRKVLMFIISAVSGFIIAFITELIQLFVPGRYGSIKDVGIDYTGYIIGTLIMIISYLIIRVIRKNIQKNKKVDIRGEKYIKRFKRKNKLVK